MNNGDSDGAAQGKSSASPNVTTFPVPRRAERSPQYSEDALAIDFSMTHENELRYVAPWGVWLLWDGARWRFERTYRAFDLARAIARDAANAAAVSKKTEGLAKHIASAGTVAAIERLARADRRHAATVDIWDVDPWLLNTPGVIIDLRTGKMLSHDPAYYMTKSTAVTPGGGCPRWLRFLDEITGGDIELQNFLQRMAGYCLTGSTSEHALFFAYGTGGNGKGVFINTLLAVLADYAAVAPMETFSATKQERHSTDLAGLRGARLVTAQETEENQIWAESRVKTLTGGDKISARFMRQDFFEYLPAFKLFIVGNHKPALRGVDESIRRRFHIIPFTETIAPEKRDVNLFEKLKAEWAGILSWAVEGCLEWQRIGLAPPEAVREATATYLGDEDAIARWIEDRCVVGRQLSCSSDALWNSWRQWAAAAGEQIGSQKKFGMNLNSHGYQRDRSNKSRSYLGISLIPSTAYRFDLDALLDQVLAD